MPRVRNVDGKSSAGNAALRRLTRSDTIHYTYEMLISLGQLPALQKETQLIRLLEAAAAEARSLCDEERAQP